MLQSATQGHREIKMDVATDIEKYRLETLFSKEPETISWIKELMRPRDVFYDVGANVGVFSLFAALFHSPIRICAFEPAYHNFSKLCINIRANNCQNVITPYCLGLAKSSHCGILNLSDASSGSAGHRIDSVRYQSGIGSENRQSGKSFQPILRQGIFAVTLDDLVQKYGLPSPHHIKIDTDGDEADVLKGGTKVLRKTVQSVLVEIDDKKGLAEIAIRSFMNRRGFNAEHSINSQVNHSRVRRAKEGKAHIKNIVFTR